MVTPSGRLKILDVESVSAARLRRSAGTAWSQRWAFAIAGLFFVAAGIGVWQMLRAGEAPAPSLRADILSAFPGKELYPSLSPDGNYVVFTWNGPQQDNTDVYVQQIGVGSPLRLTTDASADYNPVWAPDGRQIAFLRGTPTAPLARNDREIRLIPPLGPERRLASVRVQEASVNLTFLTWCPDSSCVVVTDATGEGTPDALFVITLETGVKRQLTRPQSPVLTDTSPVFSPDGRRLLFIRRSTWGFGELMVVPVHGDVTAAGEPRPADVGDLKPDYAAWLPDGKSLVFAAGAVGGAGSLWRVSADGETAPERLPYVGEDGAMPAVSQPRPGLPARLVYVRSFTDDNTWRVDVQTPGVPASGAPRVAIASTRADIHPQISPDGERVVFTSTRSGSWEIWTSDPDGANAAQLTSTRAPTGTGVPHWSPDGKQIVFASDVEGQFDIFVMSSQGGKPRNLTSHPAFDHVPIYSRDGRWIYFSSTRSGEYQIWKVPAPGGEPIPVTKEGGWTSQESIDGSFLYYSPPPRGGPATVWRMAVTGSPPVKILDGVVNYSFAILEEGAYFMTQPANGMALQYLDFSTGRSRTIAGSLGERSAGGGFAISPDGRMILWR